MNNQEEDGSEVYYGEEDDFESAHCHASESRIWLRLCNHPDIVVSEGSKSQLAQPWLITANEVQPGTEVSTPHIDHIDGNTSPDTLLTNEKAQNEYPVDLPNSPLLDIPPTARIHTKSERAFKVICRHSKDSSRISQEEFSLLSVIASNGVSGVPLEQLSSRLRSAYKFLEDDLLKLRNEGYIVITHNSTGRVERCILSRFVDKGTSVLRADSPVRSLHDPQSKGPPCNGHSNIRTGGGNVKALPQVAESTSGSTRSRINGPEKSFPNQTSGHSATTVPDNSTKNGSFDTPERIDQPDRLEIVQPTNDWVSEDHITHSIENSPSPSSKVGQSGSSGKRKLDKAKETRPKTKVKGRPRIFARGTEAFWRDQFAIAKQQANPDVKKVDMAGLSSDPISVALFSKRPKAFDETLVTAVENGLPIPEEPGEISQEWVDRTKNILNRSHNGLYITPRGVQANEWRASKPRSQIFILRSSGLSQLDLAEAHHVPHARFITSSVAHTLHYHRYYPTQESSWPSYVSTEPIVLESFASRKPPTPVNYIPLRKALDVNEDYFPSAPDLTRILVSRKRKMESFDRPPPRRKRRKRNIELFDDSLHPKERQPDANQLAEPLDPDLMSEPNPFGLPPPLTTRGARRRALVAKQGTVRASDQAESQSQANVLPSDRDSQVESSNLTASFDADEVDVMDDGAVDVDSDPDFRAGHYRDSRLFGSTPPKRVRNTGRGGSVVVLRRNVILEMVEQCSGAIPNNSTCPGAVFAQRWKASGQNTPPDITAMKRAIKSLCDSGRLKQLKFSLQNKRGVIVTRAILARIDIEATNPVITQLQRNITYADPYDYVPPELESGLDVSHPDPSSKSPFRDLPLGQSGTFGSNNHTGGAESRQPRRGGQTLTWATASDKRSLPSTLETILKELNYSGASSEKVQTTISEHFEQQIDQVLQWELQNYNQFDFDSAHKNFINHFAPEGERCPGFQQVLPLSFENDESTSSRDIGGFNPTRSSDSPIFSLPYSTAYTDPDSGAPVAGYNSDRPRPKRRRPDTKPSTTPLADRYLYNSTVGTPSQAQSRRPRQPRQPLLAPPTPKRHRAPTARRKPPSAATADGSHMPLKRHRGIQYLRTMSEDDVYRIAVTIICVRTLAGGIEKYIDWGLVMKLMPEADEQFVRDRWRTLSNRYRKDVTGLTESLQERYIGALERDEVPGVDFDDLDLIDESGNLGPDNGRGTDWEGIVRWAMKNLDRFNVKKIGDLPGSKELLGEDKEMAFEESRGMRDLLAYNVNATVPRKEEALGGIVFGTPLESFEGIHKGEKFALQVPAEIEEATEPELTLARSWVLATILTSPANWDAKKIRDKLLTLARTQRQIENLADRALKSLQRDKAVVRSREGRPKATMLEGGWEVSLKFYEHFEGKRMIHMKMLRDAARYKQQILDNAMRTSDGLAIEKDGVVDDGEMIALLNLIASGRLSIRAGDDVPKGRYGLDWQNKGYQTRLIDKTILRFGVMIGPDGPNEYLFGIPGKERRLPIPRGDMDEYFDQGRRTGKVPMWFDVLGNFQHEVWGMVVAAIIGLISIRCGIDKVEIRRTLNWCISGWEIELLLQWLHGSGYVEKTESGNGWTTREWWWLVLAD